jgi:hypothetical protein
MTGFRIGLSTFAAFIVSQVLAVAIHGFILARDYDAYEGTLLRAGTEPAWQFIFLPVSHLAFICGLMWIYTHARIAGATAARGMTLGVVGWIVGQVPLWLIWYAQQPWPGSLVVKQLGLELISSIVIGLTIAFSAGPMSPAEDSAAALTTRQRPQLL